MIPSGTKVTKNILCEDGRASIARFASTTGSTLAQVMNVMADVMRTLQADRVPVKEKAHDDHACLHDAAELLWQGCGARKVILTRALLCGVFGMDRK